MREGEKSQDPRSALYHAPTKQASQRAHKALLNQPFVWPKLAFRGIQKGLRGALWEMRDCPCCGSTINRRVTAAQVRDILAEQAGYLQRSLDVLRD